MSVDMHGCHLSFSSLVTLLVVARVVTWVAWSMDNDIMMMASIVSSLVCTYEGVDTTKRESDVVYFLTVLHTVII